MKKIIFAIMLLLWMGFIFSMSCENSNTSSNRSGDFIRVVLSAVSDFEEKPEEVQKKVVENLQFITRKSAHFIAYMILGILTILLILQYENINKKIQLSFLICVLYAISDEVHQLFVPGRAGQVRDVLIDSYGSLLGIIVTILFLKIFNKIRKEKVT